MSRDKVVASFTRAGNVLLARRITGLWTRNSELADARTRVAISPHSLHDNPENPMDDGIDLALVTLEELTTDGTVLVPGKYLPKTGRGLTIFYCALRSDLGYTRVCDALTFSSAQVVSHAELQAAPVVRGKFSSISVAPQILSTPFLQRSLTLSDSNSMSTFHSLGVEDAPGPPCVVLAGCAQAADLDVDVCLDALAMGLYDFILLLLDTLHVRSRCDKLDTGVWRQFLEYSLKYQTSALFLPVLQPDDAEPPVDSVMPSIRLLQHFATVALLAHKPYDAFPTTLDELHLKNPVIYTLVEGRAALLANRIEAQFLMPPHGDAPVANPFQRATQRRAFIARAHVDVLENARMGAKIGSPWQQHARLPGTETAYWRAHEDGYLVTFWTMTQTDAHSGFHMSNEGLLSVMSPEQFLGSILPLFQAWIALDECVLRWTQTRFQPLPPAINHFLEAEAGLVRYLHEKLQPMGPDGGRSARRILCDLPADIHTYYRPFTAVKDALLYPPRPESTGKSWKHERAVPDNDYQVVGRELVPDIENLTALLPPCMKAAVQKAKRPNDHIEYLDRRTMTFFLQSLGYDGRAATRYLQTAEPLYSGTPVVKNGLRKATDCGGIVTIGTNNARDPQLACRCPFADKNARTRACRSAAGLPAYGIFYYNPLQFVEEKLIAARKSK